MHFHFVTSLCYQTDEEIAQDLRANKQNAEHDPAVLLHLERKQNKGTSDTKLEKTKVQDKTSTHKVTETLSHLTLIHTVQTDGAPYILR